MKKTIFIFFIIMVFAAVAQSTDLKENDCATITLDNNSGGVVYATVYGILDQTYMMLMMAELQPSTEFKGSACLPPHLYDVRWIGKGCDYEKWLETQCVFTDYFFTINSGDKEVVLTPVGEPGTRVRHKK